MADLCEGGNEPPGSLKAISKSAAISFEFVTKRAQKETEERLKREGDGGGERGLVYVINMKRLSSRTVGHIIPLPRGPCAGRSADRCLEMALR
ncbi:hypothetical protein ANN_23410 [Periplaneta americana]|uniref:Uncharacterized protein n=1 Tax=Periplaneta americana TaxID=6978 RepID=A0ABQ8SLX4_PERAM|nr:hypothetical protein ANN_23410 [Periplaneta americana]